jgi:RimJ/RimL family protein N-acetyltransferase
MEIRKACRKDVQKWWDLVHTVKSEDLPTLFKMVKKITLESSQDYLSNILNSDGSFVLVCLDSDRIVGSVDVIRKKRVEECHVAEIGMCVLKEYRNKGIGALLLENTFAICRNEGKIEKIELDVFSNNKNGMKLYEKMGFEYEGTRKGSIIKDDLKLDIIMMGKQL